MIGRCQKSIKMSRMDRFRSKYLILSGNTLINPSFFSLAIRVFTMMSREATIRVKQSSVEGSNILKRRIPVEPIRREPSKYSDLSTSRIGGVVVVDDRLDLFPELNSRF
mmetsp:Transcript_35506/g.36894  ORF Transcript_35506/g.36894 Transcript_35506/m.36894 type:complete len:109 (-) Transcript_35506:35-361(-)